MCCDNIVLPELKFVQCHYQQQINFFGSMLALDNLTSIKIMFIRALFRVLGQVFSFSTEKCVIILERPIM
jgi:hypothetical protein